MIKVGDFILTNLWKDKQFKVVNLKGGFKKDCFETDIGELYFHDNRFKSWTKVKQEKVRKKEEEK